MILKKLNQRTWQVIKSLSDSLSISEISRKTGIPKTTVWRIINEILSLTRVRFVVSSRALRLRPLVAIFDKGPTLLPDYTISYREILVSGRKMHMTIGFVPDEYISEYINLFDEEPLYVFEDEEKFIWKPNVAERMKVLSFENGEIKINYDILERIKSKAEKKTSSGIDLYDLYIIRWKEHFAFTSLTEIQEKMYKEKIIASRQLLSYHFRKHVLPLWIGNTVKLYRPMREYPIRMFVYECDNAEEVAFKLSLLPYVYTIYFSSKTIFFTGQPSSKEVFNLYDKILSEYNPTPLLCEAYIKPSFYKFVIRYNELWNKSWKKPTIAYKIKVKGK